MKYFASLFFLIVLQNSQLLKAQNFQQISVDLAKVIIENNADNPLFTILDVRTPEEYNAGHIENAFNRNFYDADFEQQLDSLDKNRSYLIYCQAGVRSGFAYQMVQELGFTDVTDMLGGTGAWVAAGYPLSLAPPPNINIYASATNNECGVGNYAINAKVFLEGFYKGSEMTTELNDENLIPVNAPFGTSNTTFSSAEIPTAVDWINICLRTETEATASHCQAVILNNNGMLLNADGTECITFADVSNSVDFYVSVHHKGHLSVLSANKVANGETIDFTSSSNAALGLAPMKNIANAWVLFGGDYDENGIVNSLDFNTWSQAGASVNSYTVVDGDGNGIVNNLDFNIWQLNRSKVGLPFGF